MLIAIDFDETLTKDAALWKSFIQLAKVYEHRCICVSARRDTDENLDTIGEWMEKNAIDIPVYLTALGSKVDHMERLGIKVDIWIDDDPKRCALGH